MKRTLRLLLLRLAGWLLRHSIPTATTVVGDNLQILIVRPDQLGDVLLSRPAIEALSRAIPGAQITVAVGPWGRPALGQEQKKVIICPFPGFGDPLSWVQPYILLLYYARLLRRINRFSMVVVLRPDHWWSALLGCLAGIPLRVGYSTPETEPFLTVALPHDANCHAVTEANRLAEAAAKCGGGRIDHNERDLYNLPTSATPEDERRVADLLCRYGVADHVRLLVLHPGSNSRLKSWPLAQFAVVGAQLSAQLGMQVIVTGSLRERTQAEQLCRLLSQESLNLAGLLSWGGLEALLARASLVIGVDSGPLHLAVATGTPSVALFGPADPVQFAPWGSSSRHRVVHADLQCRPCRRLDYCRIEPAGSDPPPCMRAISTTTVQEAALRAMQEGRRTPVAIH